MKRNVKRIQFRTLIVDDDESMLKRLDQTLRGQVVRVDDREVEPLITSVRIGVVQKGGQYAFSQATLRELLEAARHRYDFIVIDYAYSSDDMQPKQWREGTGAQEHLMSGTHQLSLVDLKNALISFESSSRSNRKRVEAFFALESSVLLRSLQHESQQDSFGTYDTRYHNTQGVFPRCTIERLDSFQMIFNSDPELRRQFYVEPSNGREFYRHIVAQLTLANYRSAIFKLMTKKSGRLLVYRKSAGMSLLIVATTATGAFLQFLVNPLISAVRAHEYAAAVAFSSIGLVATMAATIAITYAVERFFSAAVDTVE